MPKKGRLKPRSTLLGPDEVARSLADLPSAAAVLPQLLRALGDYSANFDTVVSLLKMDQGVSARVMKIGNSAYYSQGYRCQSVEEALGRIGMLKTYEVVAQAAAADLLMRRLSVYGIEPEHCWRNSVTCAMAAAQIAQYADVEQAFAYTVGLLHGAGLVAIENWAIHNQEDELFLEWLGFPTDATADEKRILGFTNASVGGSLLKAWGFQPAISEPIRWQYSPDAAGANRKLACLVQVAKWLRDSAHIAEAEARPPMPEAKILSGAGVPKDAMEPLCVSVAEEFERAGRLLAPARPE